MSEQEKRIFNIISRSFSREGEAIVIVGTRCCSKEDVKKEVEHLNANVKEVEMEETGEGMFFDFLEVEISPVGKYNSNFTFSSDNKEIKEECLRNEIMKDIATFGQEFYATAYDTGKSFSDWLLEDKGYQKFIDENLTQHDMFKIISSCYVDHFVFKTITI